MSRSTWRGYAIEVVDGEWVFSDTKEPTVGNKRACGHCKQAPTPDGHDACLGELPGVRNACCGHGVTKEAYLQMFDGSILRGAEAKWAQAAMIACRDANAYNVKQVINVLRGKVTIEEIPAMVRLLKRDHPGLFIERIR